MEAEHLDVVIVDSAPEQHRYRIAELYWAAFARKFEPALGNEWRGVPFLADQLNLDRCFCAVLDGTVIGVVGYHLEGKAALGFSYRSMQKHYSWGSAPIRAVLMALLGRTPRSGELLMDGISVAPKARGLGVGTKLLVRIVEFAEEQNLSAVRLSVIDSNPRARQLYERLGFVESRSVSMGALEAVYGFRHSTDLLYRLSSEAG